jgi:hypothetical protein
MVSCFPPTETTEDKPKTLTFKERKTATHIRLPRAGSLTMEACATQAHLSLALHHQSHESYSINQIPVFSCFFIAKYYIFC